MNGLKIETPEEFLQLAKKDLALALTLVFENIDGVKKNCAAVQHQCHLRNRQSLTRNLLTQFIGGAVSAVIVIWAFLEFFTDKS